MTAIQLFASIAPTLRGIKQPRTGFLDALNAAIDIIFLRLQTKRSDLIKADLSAVVDVTGGAPYGVLPPDFRGFFERPYLSGKTIPLEPFVGTLAGPVGETSLWPGFYDIRGLRVLLRPEPRVDCTILGTYYQAPAVIASLSGVIPFDGLFDALIKETVVRILVKGPASTVDPQFEAYLTVTIDRALPRRNDITRRTRPSFM